MAPVPTTTTALVLLNLPVVLPMSRSVYPEIISSSRALSQCDGKVPTVMNYAAASTKTAHVHRALTGDDDEMDITWVPTEVDIKNGRGKPISLHVNGFELLDEPVSQDLDFMDTNEVIDVYYPMCETLLREKLGSGVQVFAFDHNVRIARDATKSQDLTLKNSGDSKAQVPLGIVHADYTIESSENRLRDLSNPPKVNDVLKSRLGDQPLLGPDLVRNRRRFCLINIWRSIDVDHPVQSYPLACVDAQTPGIADDLRVLKIHYADRIGQNYLVTPPPQKDKNDGEEATAASHRWVYFEQMKHNEALLIKQWDSDGGIAKGDGNDLSTFSIHSAFALPQSTDIPRRSIEVRCICLWPADEDADANQ